jgi:hypothetical protein
MKLSVRLPMDSPYPLTPSSALSRTSMSSKTPLEDLKDIESLDKVPVV